MCSIGDSISHTVFKKESKHTCESGDTVDDDDEQNSFDRSTEAAQVKDLRSDESVRQSANDNMKRATEPKYGTLPTW
jgi:hypothetical protein